MRRDDKNSGGQGKTSYQRQLKGGSTKGQNLFTSNNNSKNSDRSGGRDRNQERLEGDEIDLKFGFDRIKEGSTRVGWLLNFLPVSFPDDQGSERSGIDLYLIDRLGENFKATLFYRPYFYLDILEARRIAEVANQLQKRFESCVAEVVEKEDLDMPNHLSGKRHKFLKVSFATVKDLMDAKSKLWYVCLYINIHNIR